MSKGIWIKMRRAISSDPDVFKIAELTGLDRFSVVGRLHALWSWCDEHNVAERDAVSVTQSYVDHVTECAGFAEAMRQVGWLAGPDGELAFPNFNRHNGATAKRKDQTALRNRKLRSKSDSSNVEPDSQQRDAPNVTEASPDRDKDRDKEGRRKPAAAGLPAKFENEFTEAWRATPLRQFRSLAGKRRTALRQRMNESDWQENWREALQRASNSAFCCGENERGWKADVDWFLLPDSVTKILEGKYDDQKPGEPTTVEKPKERLTKAQRELVEGRRRAAKTQ